MNFRVDPDVMQTQLPSRFTPKLHNGSAVGGICLIRLEQIRPRFLPPIVGISSENAAHRIAVTWIDEAGIQREGVFIPRRDTGSRMNHLLGGRLFPGEHYLASFTVESTPNSVKLEMKSKDGKVGVRVSGSVSLDLPRSSQFSSVADASQFFEPGSIGFSATKDAKRLDGISLKTKNWKVVPLDVTDVYSSYFSNEEIFPEGTVHFDCALLMTNIAHQWHSEPDLYI